MQENPFICPQGSTSSAHLAMAAEPVIGEDRFLSLLRERRHRRDAELSSLLGPLHTRVLLRSQPASARVKAIMHRANEDTAEQGARAVPHAVSNLSTHYLFSSSRPQNQIQNPYPTCFEGYPKLQR
jgi:hypothetical protein